jgi:hypothetical protein
MKPKPNKLTSRAPEPAGPRSDEPLTVKVREILSESEPPKQKVTVGNRKGEARPLGEDTSGLDGTHAGSCVVCLEGTDTGLAIVGDAEYAAAGLAAMGVPITEAIATIAVYAERALGFDQGTVPTGKQTWVLRVCRDCADRGEGFAAVSLIVPGASLPAYSQADLSPLTWQPTHEQVELPELGFTVDRGLEELVRLCWHRGIATSVCCVGSGDPSDFHDGDGWIGFFDACAAWRWEDLTGIACEWNDDEEVATEAEVYFAPTDVAELVGLLRRSSDSSC